MCGRYPQRVPYPGLPSADSSDNNNFADVIGNKNDSEAGDSIWAQVHTAEEHIHTASQVYPTLADGVVVTAGAAWVLGAFATVVPASAIGSAFDIHHVSIENLSANDVYELVLYYGDTDIECGRVRITKNAVQDGTMNIPMQTPIIPPDSRIRAKLASKAGGSTATISVFYHTY